MSYVGEGLGNLNILQLRRAPASRPVAGVSLLNLRLLRTVPRTAPPVRLMPPLNIMPPGAGLPVQSVVPAPAQPADPITMTSSMDMVPQSATTSLADPDPGVVDENAPPPVTDAPAAPKPALSPVLVLGGLALLLFLRR